MISINNKSCTLLIFGLLLLAHTAVPNLSYGKIIFIANKSVTVDTVSANDIQQIFMGEKIKWNNNLKVSPSILTKSEPLKFFLNAYTDMTPLNYKRHWKKLLFTGAGTFPKFFKDETDIIKYVSETDGAIGYVSNLPESIDVKIIKIK